MIAELLTGQAGLVTAYALAFVLLLPWAAWALEGRRRVLRMVGGAACVLYALGYLSVTLLFREVKPLPDVRAPLWSYRASLRWSSGTLIVIEPDTLVQMWLNVVLTMPLGALLPFVRPVLRGGSGLLAACLTALVLSALTEGTQLLLRIGVCELDDVLHNTLGGAAGYALYMASQRAVRRFAARKRI